MFGLIYLKFSALSNFTLKFILNGKKNANVEAWFSIYFSIKNFCNNVLYNLIIYIIFHEFISFSVYTVMDEMRKVNLNKVKSTDRKLKETLMCFKQISHLFVEVELIWQEKFFFSLRIPTFSFLKEYSRKTSDKKKKKLV